MANASFPLHRVIDAARLDAERLLGRLIVLVHAAFLDAGFVPVPLVGGSRSKRGPVPRQLGTAASGLSLRYTAPQLTRRRDAEAAVLRILAHGRRHLVLYVQPWDDPSRPAERCALVDALAAAALLAGCLDATARALRRDAALSELWGRLSGELCRRALVDLCGRNGVVLEPKFTSLPDDARAAILARLTDGADLARVECVCAALRRLVADRDRVLWRPAFEALPGAPWFPGDNVQSPEEPSWKERYIWAWLWQRPQPRVRTGPFSWLAGDTEPWGYQVFYRPVFGPFLWSRRWLVDLDDPVEPPEAPSRRSPGN